jgi:dephospho-CoA kinase
MANLHIGLTGGIGSGKTTIGKYFAAWGIDVFDADATAKDLLQHDPQVLEKLKQRYGNILFDQQHQLQRRQLREIIFNHPREKQWLEQLLHPKVRTTLEQQAQQSSSPYCILMVPLLLEKSQVPQVHHILVVDAPEKLQIERTMKRDQCKRDSVLKIMDAQTTRKQRLKKADDVIINDGDLEYLKQQVAELHKIYEKMAEKNKEIL